MQVFLSPIFRRWKLVKQLHCFGDNQREKDKRKIKLCGLKTLECNFWSEAWKILAKKGSIWEIKGDILVSSEICRMKGNYYQYARLNDKLPTVKTCLFANQSGKCICRPDSDWGKIEIYFCKILRNKYNIANVLPKRFLLNGNAVRFYPVHTQA